MRGEKSDEAGVIIVVEAGESGVRDGEWDGE